MNAVKNYRASVCAALALCLLLSGCGAAVQVAQPSPTPELTATFTPVPMPTPTSAPTPTPPPTPEPSPTEEPTPTPEPSPTPTPTPSPTPVPTPTPAGPKAQRSGELIVPADWGVRIPERTGRAEESFFADACMIGNSFVQGFFMHSGMGSTVDCMYMVSATVYDALDEIDLRHLRNLRYSNVYIMLGLNELAYDAQDFAEHYGEIIDYVRHYQPRANIIVVSVAPIERWVDERPGSLFRIDQVTAFNNALMALCEEKGCWYLDAYSVWRDDEGYLDEFYAYHGDGLHMEPTGYMLWNEYMCTHYVDEGLLTE